MEKISKILVVDDDSMMTRSIQGLLGTKGYEIQTTNSAYVARDYIKNQSFDLVLLDVMMPEMTGFQLMDALDRTNLDTYFIIMTGDASMDSAIEAIRKGACDYLKKPFEPEELLIRVENVFKQKRLKDEHYRVAAQKKQLEEQLRQSQKMEAIGTLAGGIAHDFNNILGIILGNSELAMESTPEWNPVRQNLEQIFTAGIRAKEITYQLLSFCRKSDTKKHPLNLNTIIGESLKLMRASLPANIEISQDFMEETHTVLGDATQIHQIMINLCTNAAHAMQENGGTIEVRLEKITLDDASIDGYNDLTPGDYIKLAVADMGHGIDPSIMDRIFDPYFTTKDLGKGTGLGLSLVQGIVKSHGGDIKVDSQPGKFTKFNIYLPILNEAISDIEIDATDTLPTGGERILLVDDEKMIVNFMTQIIKRLGYRVSPVNESRKALEAFRRYPDRYDLVISDMAMPNLNGIYLAQAMRKIRSDIPIIVCTGYSEELSPEKAKQYGIQKVIMKPVRKKELAHAIREVLDSQGTDRRKDRRFKALAGAFVISKSDSREQGKVLDISMSGMSFKYGLDNKIPAYLDKVSINKDGENFLLDNLAYRTISDTMLAGSIESNGETRRRGVRFESLTPIQTGQLNFFIKHHTEGAAN